MGTHRNLIARTVSALILAGDALFVLVVGHAEASHPASAGGFSWSTLLSAVTIAALFILPLVLLLAGPGVERSGPAEVVAWLVAVVLPLGVYVLTALSWGSGGETRRWDLADDALMIGVLHTTIPTLVRWARGSTLAGAGIRTGALFVAALLFLPRLLGWW